MGPVQMLMVEEGTVEQETSVTHEAEKGPSPDLKPFTLSRCTIPGPSADTEMEKIQPQLSQPSHEVWFLFSFNLEWPRGQRL